MCTVYSVVLYIHVHEIIDNIVLLFMPRLTRVINLGILLGSGLPHRLRMHWTRLDTGPYFNVKLELCKEVDNHCVLQLGCFILAYIYTPKFCPFLASYVHQLSTEKLHILSMILLTTNR